MIKRITTLLVANLLFLIGNLYSQVDMGLLDDTETSQKNGLYVAVYAIPEEQNNLDRLIADLRNGLINEDKIKLIYSKQDALVFPFDSKPYEYYPATLSTWSEGDFANLNLELRENFLINWRGKIKVPKGYFALRLTKVDDEASIFIYDDPEIENAQSKDDRFSTTRRSNSKDEGALSKDIPFVAKRGPLGFLPRNRLSYVYFKKEQFVNIEIFYLQKKNDFSFKVDAMMGLDLEDIRLQTGKKTWKDIEPLQVEEDFIFKKNGEWWKPLSEYAEFLFSPDTKNYREDSVFEFNKPANPNSGFKGEIVKLSHKQFPFQDEQTKMLTEKIANPLTRGWATRSMVDNMYKNYWESECNECLFHTYMPQIINEGDKLIKEGKFLLIGPYLKKIFKMGPLQENEDQEEFLRDYFKFQTYGNNSLRLHSDNFGRMNQDFKLFNLFKKSFDWLAFQMEDEDLIKDSKRFKEFVFENLFMTLIKFSGKLRLPEGYLGMSFLKEAKSSAIVFLNKNKTQFSNLDDLLKSAFIYNFQNNSNLFKNRSIYSGEIDEIVNIEIYLFHYSGPLSMQIGIDLDGKGYKDLSELEEYIVPMEKD